MCGMALTDKERQFVDEYLIDRNKVQAYRRAFGAGKSYASDAVKACKVFKKANIREELKAAQADARTRCRVRADKVITAIANVAFADPLELFDADGNPRTMRDVPRDLRLCIAGIKANRERSFTDSDTGETTKTTIIEYKFNDRMSALDKLVKHLGLTQEITPLEAFLTTLPPGLREQVRAAIAGNVPTGSDSGGTRSDPAIRG